LIAMDAPTAFGDLLRHYRQVAGLTQHELAERAGLSVHGIQKLERGTTHPYRDTANRLELALHLSADESAHFREVARPVRRHQTAPSVAIGDARRDNLPTFITTFIPRAGEIERVTQRLTAARLLTITGPGGCGKSRLATEVARQLVGDFAGGVWLVDLAPLADATLVPQSIATVLDLHEGPNQTPLDVLMDRLRNQRLLLVLDNCEHVVDAAAHVVDELVRACPDVSIIATSRELLGVSGEAAWRVGPLSMPSAHDLTVPIQDLTQSLLGSESGQLFADRAQLAVPSFAITGRTALAVTQICRRLDGIPLAIELAAARLTSLSVDQIAARLDQRFRLLTGGMRTALRRQQTLEATIDWSHELLAATEQRLFRRLAVFVGGWSLEAAEAIAGNSETGDPEVLELLSRLVTKSMVLVEEPSENAPDVRYRFLETIRQYAEQKLLQAGEADRVRTRHRDWYLHLAKLGFEGMEGPDQKEWWDRLDLDHDNLRAALSWSASDTASNDQLLRIAGRLGRFWQWRGYAREGIAWLEMALGRSEPHANVDRAWALNWRGQLEVVNGNGAAGVPFLEQSIADARTLGDDRLLSVALRHLGFATDQPGPGESSRRLFEEAVAVSRAGGWEREIAWNLSVLGRTLALAGELDKAEELLDEGVLLGRHSGDMTAVMSSLLNLGIVYGKRGELTRARQVLIEAAELGKEINVRFMTAASLMVLGAACVADRDPDAAELAYRAALEEATRGTTRGMLAPAGRHYAALLQGRGDHIRAVRILTACASIRQSWDAAVYFQPVATADQMLEAARRALGEVEFARAVGAGESLAPEEAILAAITSSGAQPSV
jgi:non-specific serine/threonine protein kinase